MTVSCNGVFSKDLFFKQVDSYLNTASNTSEELRKPPAFISLGWHRCNIYLYSNPNKLDTALLVQESSPGTWESGMSLGGLFC